MLKKRVIVALLSAIIFSIILSYISYTPISEREPNTWYESFGSLVTVYLLFSVPAYLLGGVPVSLFIDRYVKKGIIKLLFYLIAGFFVGVATIVISFMTVALEVLSYGVLGLCASLLFFVLMLLTKRFE